MQRCHPASTSYLLLLKLFVCLSAFTEKKSGLEKTFKPVHQVIVSQILEVVYLTIIPSWGEKTQSLKLIKMFKLLTSECNVFTSLYEAVALWSSWLQMQRSVKLSKVLAQREQRAH